MATKPRNVRNWWIEITVDGRTQKVGLGPRAHDGGFEMTIKQREEGEVAEVLAIRGVAESELLRLFAYAPDDPTGLDAILVETER